MGNIFVPAMGVMLLAALAMAYSRSSDDLAGLGFLAAASGVVVVGLCYFKFRRVLNQLDGQIKDATLATLCHCANSMAAFGYLACLMALLFGRHH
jgi:hypothetical protein